MLQKVQLLVAGGVGEVITGGTFAALFCSKRRIGEDYIIAPHTLAQIGQGVTQNNSSLNIMQHGVHQGQTVGIVYQLRTSESLRPLKGSGIRIQIKEVISLGRNILMGRDHKAKCSAGRVVATLLRLRFHQTSHHINQHTGRKILSCARFFLVGVLLQKPLIQIAQPLFTGRKPVQSVNGGDDFFKVFRLVNVGGCALIDFPHTAYAVLAQMVQQFFIEFLQFNTALGGQIVPAVGFWYLALCTRFLRHFQEQDIGQLRDILVIGDAVITENIAEVPELGYDFLGGHQ